MKPPQAGRIAEFGSRRRNSLLFALLSFFLAAMAHGGNDDTDILSAAERAWLGDNQARIVLAVETGYAPFVFLDAKGGQA